MDRPARTALMELERKLSRACQTDRGATLTAAEVNAFVAVGGLKIISDAAQAGLVALAQQRVDGATSTTPATQRAVEQRARPFAASVVRTAAVEASSQRNEAEHRAAERQAIEAAEAIRRKRRARQPAP